MTSRSDAAAPVYEGGPEFNQMSEEEQEFLRTLAAEVSGMLDECEKKMAQKWKDQLFDNDEGLAFWSLLPAKVRTAIKRGGM